MSVFVLEHVSKSFKCDKKDHLVLDDINLTLPDNGLVSILGKSGSGKSTLLNILMGIEHPSKGKVLFNHKDISKYSDRKFSQYHLNGVSLIFQHYNLFSDFTAYENAVLPLKMKGEKSKKIKVKTEMLFKRFGITELMNRKVQNLSGGEKQRVAIIRSLLTKPKAILCDEPTGALDHENSIQIMDILKEISKNTLVVMVSHNKELVYKYSDQILTLRDGKIVENISSLETKFTSQFSKEKYLYKSSWTRKILKHNLLKNFKKNLFSVIACSISFTAMFISVGFSEGSKASQDNALKRNLSIGYATVSETEFIELEGSPLQYEKTKRPSFSLIDETFSSFTSIRYEENLSYLISNYPKCTFNNSTYNNFSMVPVYDLSLSNFGNELLKEGKPADNSFDEIIVNTEFEDLLGCNLLNKTIVFSNTSSINYSTGNQDNPFVKDTLVISKKLKVVGIVNEFSFLNTPKIYFSYKGARKFLKGEMMDNLSIYYGKFYSFYDYLTDCNNDDPVSSYSSYLFLENLNEINSFFDVIKNQGDSNVQVTSTVLDIKETYSTFIESFSTTLILFVLIAFIGINLILGMISFSTFIENKKKTAIMTCLGARNGSIHNLYLSENFLVIFLSVGLSIVIAYLLQPILNNLVLLKYGLSNLIEIPFKNYVGIQYGLILFLLSIALIFSTIFTLTPMILYRNKSIADELRDE